MSTGSTSASSFARRCAAGGRLSDAEVGVCQRAWTSSQRRWSQFAAFMLRCEGKPAPRRTRRRLIQPSPRQASTTEPVSAPPCARGSPASSARSATTASPSAWPRPAMRCRSSPRRPRSACRLSGRPSARCSRRPIPTGSASTRSSPPIGPGVASADAGGQRRGDGEAAPHRRLAKPGCRDGPTGTPDHVERGPCRRR